ncbi:hypothetical protein IWQ49_003766 [Labrenzia sp. EL_126]|nr:hypothetical protein [Labrenzia sp. EL_126]
MSFTRWPLTWKICTPVFVIAIFTVALAGISLTSLKEAMLQERLVKSVASAAENTRDTADKVDASAQELTENAVQLRGQVATFLDEVRRRSAA